MIARLVPVQREACPVKHNLGIVCTKGPKGHDGDHEGSIVVRWKRGDGGLDMKPSKIVRP